MKNTIMTIKFLVAISAMVFLLSFTCPPRGIYDIKIKSIDGEMIVLSKYHRKKIVFVTLSGKETDAVLDQLAAFCTKYKDSAAVFGILSIEDGYNEMNKNSIKKIYESKTPELVLTEGMYTRKVSAGQSVLMQWFTHVDQNQRYDQDVAGTGWKFFVDEAGMLYAALSPQAVLTSPVIQRVMSKPVPKMPPAPTMEKRQEQKKG